MKYSPINYHVIPSILGFAFLVLFSCNPKEHSDEEGTEGDETDMASMYANPLDVAFGDPYILNDGDGNYFMYGTGGGAEDGFAAYSSDNLVDWKFEGQVYRGNTEDSWASKFFWAPEVYKIDGKYYMFFSAQWKVNPTNEEENFMIGVAVSDSPTGPFTEMHDRPIFDPGYPIIDANVYEEDGRYYLYYSRACYKHPVESEVAKWAKEKGWYDEIEESWVYGVELKPDFSGIIGEPVLCLRPPLKMDDAQAEWESRSVTKQEINRRWTEGSVIFKHEGTYYIMYSSNYYAGQNYAVGYATGKHPLGPFTKASNNPVLELNTHKGGEVTGTGHNNIVFLDNGEMYCVYHGRTKASGQDRVVFLDKMEIKDDGTLVVQGPTTSAQPMPIK
ncbi:glycoside hydrolase family 43 protein [Echinicola vietnamensis]|uniref:Beta-xylosidase n=1 Tax=Echinicola vietnamensis (strain DSM 17526 / LMG 23754 / KMM 6221) TaxID=926556 RepID=L0FYN0_ECHVK|nr:glycoside hydrolase family 43 protein [Echinicola vietnamensis]AGA78999.1 beta-xylosidase [Echinicola vietnamensis DSM 17526]